MRRRRVGLILIVSAMAPLAIAATAWACGVLATLRLDKGVAAPGATVTATGVNYARQATVADGTFTPVQFRLDSRSGPVIAEATPDTGGVVNKTFSIPASAGAGWHVINATQYRTVDGVPKSGTPGRTTIRVQGSAASSSGPAASPWSSSKPSGPGGSQAPVAVDAGGSNTPTLLAIGLSLALLGTGLTLVARGRSSRPLPSV